MRQAYDFSPLYGSMIGADRMVGLLEAALRAEGDRSYPPYDIEKIGEDSYRVTLATAGFAESELEITAQPNLLVVAARRGAEGERTYLHQGLAHRAFERRFDLADHVVVKGAAYTDGLLTIDLAREVPEAMRPRRIEIGGAQVTSLEDRTRPRGRRAA
jgi:molecular chaperone IbpA